jgi:hypothetical protein
MAADPRKRQKQMERRAAKRKTKLHAIVREKSAGLSDRLAGAANYPIADSVATVDLWDQGLGWICLSRELPNGGVAYAIFLVDRYCLGVKNAMAGIVSRFDYDGKIMQKMKGTFRSREIAPATARRFVESAVAYARGLGFPPHPDYQRAKQIFGTIDSAEATEELEFGREGKPVFIAGPNDSAARCRQILATLERSCGLDGSHFVVPIKVAMGDELLMPPNESRHEDTLED